MFLKRLLKELERAIDETVLEEPTEVQAKCMPVIKSGADLLCKAGEKSGKTTIIVLGVIQRLKAALNDVPRALIVVPDEESAILMKEEFDRYGKYTNLRVFVAYEKQDIYKLRNNIYFGSDVVIGSAARLNELYSNSGLNLNDLKMFITDDAEEVFRHSTVTQMDRLGSCIPKCQHVLFTNQLTGSIERFADEYMTVHDILEI